MHNNSYKIDKMDKIDMSISKKILCFNVTNGKQCTYGSKCMYAHSLNEQKIEPMRHKVYTILRNNNDLSKLNLINDSKLFNTMLQLTKVCMMCVKKICPGGYNCRNGAISTKFRICYDDLVYGNCKRQNCYCIHLTARHIIPYMIQKQKYDNDNYIEPSASELDDENDNINKKQIVNLDIDKCDNIETNIDTHTENNMDFILNTPEPKTNSIQNSIWYKPPKTIFSQSTPAVSTPLNNYISPIRDIVDTNDMNYKHKKRSTDKMQKRYYKNKIIKSNRILKDLSGILLTEKFLIHRFSNSENDKQSESSDEDVESVIRYLNSVSDDDEYDESIFQI